MATEDTEDMASDNPSASTTQRWPAVLCWTLAGLILAAIPAVIFPGDAPFINDEPLLIMSALDSNEAHRLALHGLPGNRGLLYGPLPTWIYQVLLLITHDPILLVAIHSAVLAAAILVPLFWLARDTRLWPPFALVIALSPQVWFQTRQLWDNTFNIPICAIALAAYAHFLAHRSRSGLAVAVAGLAMAPFVHPMAFAFVIPVALHIIIFERRALVENIWIVAPFPVLLLALSGKYLRLTFESAASWGKVEGMVSLSQGMSGFLFPLLGGRFFSADGFFAGWNTSGLADVARHISMVSFPMVWAGMALAAWRILGVVRRQRTADLRDHVAAIALAVVVAQSLLDGLLKLGFHTHYFNATWIAYAILAWLVADALVRAGSRWWRAVGWLIPLHGAALAIVAVDFTASVHARPGTHFGLTIAQQAEVARDVARYPRKTPVTCDVYPFKDFPHALTAVRRLLGPQPGPVAPAKRLEIKRRSADPSDGRVMVTVVE